MNSKFTKKIIIKLAQITSLKFNLKFKSILELDFR